MRGWYFLLEKQQKSLTKGEKNAAKPFGTRNSKGATRMNKYPIQLREKVNGLIGEMEKYAYLFSKNGGKDFTRKRKIPFSKVIKSLIYMGGQSLNRELLEIWHLDQQTPTGSAFIQQRSKLSKDALPFLFEELNEMFPGRRDIDGYRILACDGSDLHYAANPKDTASYFRADENSRGYNLLHLNALYDLQSKRYVDAIVQPRREADEIGAFISMIDRFKGDEKTIFVADRGYESYNVLAHIQERGMKYVLRIKKPSSSGILKSLHLQENCTFDLAFSYVLTKKQTNFVKQDRGLYHILTKEHRFDFCDLHHALYYPISFRVVSVEIAAGVFEYLITNLDPVSFPPDKLKCIYKLRWGIETSFRDLKYTIGLSAFHSKKAEFISQEIFARLIFYNLCEMVVSHAAIFHRTASHVYQLNFSQTVHILRRFFSLVSDAPPLDVISLIHKYLLPVRPDRCNPRKVHSRSAVSFIYRIA